MRKFRRTVVTLLSATCLIGASALAAYRASQAVPDFYQVALGMQADLADIAGDQLERNLVAAASEAEEGHTWQLILTDEQINGWLASDLKQKFPQMLPTDIQEPRVAFQHHRALVACRLATGALTIVLSFKLDAYVTERPNEIAVRVHQVRAGNLPVPLAGILEQVASAARQSGIRVRWSQEAGDPVALVELPIERHEQRPGILLKQLVVGNGEMVVSGTHDLAESQALWTVSPERQVAQSASEISIHQP